MGELFAPGHLIILAGVFGILAMIIVFSLFKVAKAFSARSSNEQTANPAPSIDMSSHKFCSECGKQILRRAEICPLCGCRVA
jgi:Zinc finger, C3HC4 type (RING finger)